MAEEIDIGTELYEEVKKSFESKYNNHYMIQDILKKIKSGKARFEDTATYSRCVGNALANAIIENVTQDKLPIGQMYYNIADKILRPTLKNNYELINAAAASVQEKLDKNANLRIKAQKAEFPSERVNSIVNAASEKGAAWETVQRRMTSPVENITESFYNDYIQTNAEFRSKAGLDVYIVRDDHSGCCEWCAKLAGKYTYPDEVPEDIYRRHDNCTCTVTYYNGKERQNIWTKKSWQATDEESERRRELGKAQPTKLSREEAKAKEREIIEKNPLTFGRKSGIIKTRGLSAKIGGDGFIEEHEEPKLIRIIDPTDKTAIRKELIEFEKTVVSEPIEHGCVVTKDGEVYHCFGTKDRVFVDSDLGDKLNGAYVSHNHPMSETEFSFSSDDIRMFYSTNMNELVGFDEKYEYRLSRTDLTIDKEPENWDMSENVQHTRIILSIQDDYNSEFGYTRKERGK